MLPPKIKTRVNIAQTLWNKDAVPAQPTTVSSSAHLSSTKVVVITGKLRIFLIPGSFIASFIHKRILRSRPNLRRTLVGCFAGNLTERLAE